MLSRAKPSLRNSSVLRTCKLTAHRRCQPEGRLGAFFIAFQSLEYRLRRAFPFYTQEFIINLMMV